MGHVPVSCKAERFVIPSPIRMRTSSYLFAGTGAELTSQIVLLPIAVFSEN
jgi:hypothetical protein